MGVRTKKHERWRGISDSLFPTIKQCARIAKIRSPENIVSQEFLKVMALRLNTLNDVLAQCLRHEGDLANAERLAHRLAESSLGK
jgi:hypothetical protein